MSNESLLGLFAMYGYGIVFVAILLDNAGLPIPGELLLLAFGGLARGGELDLVAGLAVATVVFGQFVVGARPFFAPLAGWSRMPFPRFLLMDGLGCLLWAGSFIVIGYLAGGHLIALAVAGLGTAWLIVPLIRTLRARRA